MPDLATVMMLVLLLYEFGGRVVDDDGRNCGRDKKVTESGVDGFEVEIVVVVSIVELVLDDESPNKSRENVTFDAGGGLDPKSRVTRANSTNNGQLTSLE